MAVSSARVTMRIVVGVVACAVAAALWGELRGVDVAATEFRLPVGDGVELDATVFVPEGAGPDAPVSAVLVAHGFGGSRQSVMSLATQLAAQGHVVLTWSARGFGESGGRIALNAPEAEIADVSALVDWLADQSEVRQDGPDDPRVGMTGASYGGAATLLAGAADNRIDALVAVSAWHSLVSSFSPNAANVAVTGVLKQQWLSVLFTTGATPAGGLEELLAQAPATTSGPAQATGSQAPAPCGPFALEVCRAYAASAERGRLTDEAAALLARAGLEGRLGDITAPTLLVHARGDTLFPVAQSLANARGIAATGTPVALRWLPGGHDLGTTEGNLAQLRAWTSDWLARWLDDRTVDTGPVFASVARPTGSDRVADEVLPAASTRTLALSADGRLTTPADAVTGTRSWLNPPGGVPAALSSLPGSSGLAVALPPIDLPGQHVAFTSEQLTEAVELLGAAELEVTVDGTSDEVVLFTKVYDVAPGGEVSLPQQVVAPVRLTDPPTTTTITLPTLDHTFAPGHRIRLVFAATDRGYVNPRTASVSTVAVGPAATLGLPIVPVAAATGGALVGAVGIVVGLAALVAVALVWAQRRRPLRDVRPDPSAPAVRVTNLHKEYDSGVVAVDGADLEVAPGQVFGLLGPNGAGKTTLLRMALGLIAPTAGEVHLLGHRIGPSHPILGHVGALVEGPGFAPYRSGHDNLVDWWRAGGRPLAEAHLDEALAVADLGEAVHRPVGTYSHGMRQRLAIAQALLGNPRLLILDEPTDGLDPGQIRGMRDLLSSLATEGRTVVVSSHLLAEVEQVCTHAAVLVAGRVVASGPVADLGGRTRSIEVRASDERRAEQVLIEMVGRERVQRQGSGVVADLDGQPVGDVIAALVAADVDLQAVTPRRRLEDAFLQLVEEDRS